MNSEHQQLVDKLREESGSLRLFIAVAFNDAIRAAGAELIRRLQTGARFTGAFPTWVKAVGLHQTLVFLGNQPPTRVQEICALMESVSQHSSPFRVSVGGVHFFPTDKNPRVISVGLRGDVESLHALQLTLSERCRAAGLTAEDRPFRPHVTLARIKSMRGLPGLRDVVAMHRAVQLGEMVVDRITLYRSRLHPDGAEYDVLYESFLSAPQV